ncbi:MAG TPA: helix-turn-helix transcriptional regulator [Vicinamibacterales bacterium]|nr:helix-turn-helix transcriptional regulator [Vicinamibacterales bacterium]
MNLRPVEFHILLALAADERHGYALLQEVASLTDGEIQLEPGTLYRALHRMLKNGWVAESARRPAADQDDERRRYYRLTPLGRRIASTEAERLCRLVTIARAHRLLSRA